MTSPQVTVYTDWVTIFWTVANLFLLLLVLAGLFFGVRYFIRLNRRVKRIEDRLNQKDH